MNEIVMKTRILAVILSVVMVFTVAAFSGCGKKNSGVPESVKRFLEYDLTEMATVGQYKGITVVKEPIEITEEDIDTQINLILTSHAEKVAVTDRGILIGDSINMNYTGYLDGVEFEGGSAENVDIVVGSSGYIDGFDDGLVGAKTGEEVTLDLTFPDPYLNNEELSGKPVQFVVKINSVSESIVPEMSVEFLAENYPEYESVEMLREALELTMYEGAVENQESQLLSEAWEEVLKNTTIHSVPEDEYNKLYDEMIAWYRDFTASSFNMELEAYLIQYQNMEFDEFKESIHNEVISYLTETIVLYTIVKNENLSLTDAEYQEGAKEYLDYYGMTDIDELEASYSYETIYENLLWDKAFNCIMENVVYTEGEVSDS